jgi:hypothetical protein
LVNSTYLDPLVVDVQDPRNVDQIRIEMYHLPVDFEDASGVYGGEENNVPRWKVPERMGLVRRKWP